MSRSPAISAIDLFCGVGGLTHGLSLAGVDVRLGVDVDPATKYPYSANNNADFLLADVRKLESESLVSRFTPGTATLLAGCAPCQPFSTYAQKTMRKAHSQLSLDSEWALVERFGELISDLGPDLVAMENVPPLLKKPVFEKFTRYLKGYFFDVRILDCRDIGMAQTRKRLVLVASRLGMIKLPICRSEPRSVRDIIGDLPALRAGQVDKDDRIHKASDLSEINLKRIQASRPGGTWRDWPDELRASCHVRKSGATYPAVYGRMRWDEPAPTITTQCFGYGNGRFGHPDQDRAISLREAAMLQGFPRNYAFLDESEPVSFASLGRLIGNAVPVDLGRLIGEVLVQHIASVKRLAGAA